MPILILMRHAKAVRPHEAPDDLSRGLTERGRREAAEAGERIVSFGIAPHIAIVSPSERTRQTWDALRAVLPQKPKLAISDALYEAGPEKLWEIRRAEAEPDAAALMIGHNPAMNELIARLLRQASDRSDAARRLSEHLPTSGFAAFSLAGETLAAPGPSLIGWGRLAGD